MVDTVPDTMLAALCAAPGAPLEISRIDVPKPGRGEIMVKMESCGVCFSDLHLRDGDENLPDALYPLVLGHEGIGRVVRHGAGCADAPDIGQRVGLPWLYDTCLDCKPCLTGAETFCASQNARGIQRHGAFAQYAILDSHFACVIPDEIDPIAGAPLLCAGLTAWSALKKTRIAPGLRVLIIGAGGLGQYAILIAKAYGAHVIVVDSEASKLDEAVRLKADEVYLAGPQVGKAIQQAGGADVTVNFAPSAAVWQTIETAVNPMSDVVAVALVHQPVDLSMMWLIDGGHRVFGSSVGSRQELREFLAFSARNPLDTDVETIAFRDVNTALDRLKAGRVTGRLCIDFADADQL